ncbi:MAG: hypothetical protein HQL97_13500 [Magnetococcales bacterium]|nr:hypothetical protein [Magnetococcales bacterium]
MAIDRPGKLSLLERRRLRLQEEKTRQEKEADDRRERTLQAANSALEVTRQVHLVMLLVGIFGMVMVLTTTDKQLLVQDQIKIPLLDVSLDIVELYRWGPILWVVMNFNLLLTLNMLGDKLRAAKEAWADHA